MTSTTHIEQSAMLVRLHITRWTARKSDKTASNKLTDEADATRDVARVTKDILPRKLINAIGTQYDAAHRTDKHMTLPWSDDGRRLIPAPMVMAHDAAMKKHRTSFWAAVADLQMAYDEERDKAKAALGSLFNSADYPPADTIPSKFSFGWELENIAISNDIRVAMPESLKDRIAQDMDTRLQERLTDATKHTFERVYNAVKRMHGVLSADKPKVYDSLAGDMAMLISVLPHLNMTNDPALAQLCMDLQNSFAGLDTATLRSNEATRVAVVDSSAKIMQDLEGLL